MPNPRYLIRKATAFAEQVLASHVCVCVCVCDPEARTVQQSSVDLDQAERKRQTGGRPGAR